MLKEQGVGVDYMRVRAFPFSEDVEKFLAAHELLFVVEQNRDAQLRALLTLETAVEKAKLRSLLHYSGLPISSAFIVEGVLAELRAAPPGAPARCRRMADARRADMTFIAKPKVATRRCRANALGLTRRDYEGALSTLCAGCGHDSITAAIVEASWGLSHRAAERGEALRDRLLVQDHGVFRLRRPRLQLRARPHALDRHGRQRRQPQPAPTSASPATAIRSRSGSGSSATRSAAT